SGHPCQERDRRWNEADLLFGDVAEERPRGQREGRRESRGGDAAKDRSPIVGAVQGTRRRQRRASQERRDSRRVEKALRGRPAGKKQEKESGGGGRRQRPQVMPAARETETVGADAGEDRQREKSPGQRLRRVADPVERRDRSKPRSGRAGGGGEDAGQGDQAEQHGQWAALPLGECAGSRANQERPGVQRGQVSGSASSRRKAQRRGNAIPSRGAAVSFAEGKRRAAVRGQDELPHRNDNPGGEGKPQRHGRRADEQPPADGQVPPGRLPRAGPPRDEKRQDDP